MKTFFVLFSILCCSSLSTIAQDALPAIRILPGDVVQDTIKRLQHGTNKFTVRWTYTEQGARKMLEFKRAHAGQQVLTQIGGFECRATISTDKTPGWTEEGWLKWRTDKFFGVSEEDAKKIIAGLKVK